MKLYVWNNPYPVRYGGSMVFAVAETLEQAVSMCKMGKAYTYGEYQQDNKGMPDMTGVEPLRVLHLPCAEWHEWRE